MALLLSIIDEGTATSRTDGSQEQQEDASLAGLVLNATSVSYAS